MKAIQVIKPYDIKIIEKEKPNIKNAKELIIKVKKVGICGSDIHIYHGTSPVATYPRVIGHEIIGVVDTIGTEVEKFNIGDRVVIEPIEYCGECYACKQGRGNICEELAVLGVHKDGGFQEYICVKEKQVYKIPDEVSDTQAVMMEPYTIGYQANSRGNVKKDDVVLIYGCGPVGLIALDIAKSRGAICYSTDFNEKRLKLAQEFGADGVFDPSKVDVNEEISRLTNGSGANVIIDAVGLPSIISEAVKNVSVAGRVVSMGFSEEPATVTLLDITKKEVEIVGTRLQSHKFQTVIDEYPSKLDKIDKLITHTFYFEEFKEAFDLIENNPQEVGKIVLSFDH